MIHHVPMQVTFEIPDELVTELVMDPEGSDQTLPEVFLLGLREWQSRPQEGFTGFAEILEFLAALPTPEEILALQPSPALQEQIDHLATKHKAQELTAREQLLWRQYEYLEHIVRMAKAKAYLKLNSLNAA